MVRISSSALGKSMGLTASQIRQDLFCFGGFGQQGYGYNVRTLYEEIGKILGLDKAQTMIIVGAGRLGQALANYVRFEKRGFCVIGVFDSDPALVGKTVRQCTIQPSSELADFLDSHHVDIVTLAIPRKNAPEVAHLVVEHGVHAIWNFAHVDLEVY